MKTYTKENNKNETTKQNKTLKNLYKPITNNQNQ